MYCRRVYNSSVQWFFRRLYSSNEETASSKSSTEVVCNSFLPLDLDKSIGITRRRSGLFGAVSSFPSNIIRKMSTQSSSSKSTGRTNRLILEKSPYLLQHATNPIDWYPWGEEAFEKAKTENKLIFLSVGYSTCHWCHVMEKESFEDESVAEIMNKYYVSIKVDREERPDVDKLYMSFIQATAGGGGWPMSVFLSPDLEPLTGGTYFPPEDNYGRPGFKTILNKIAEQWITKKTSLLNSGKHVMEILKHVNSKHELESENIQVPGADSWKKCLSQISRSYESDFGGFSSAPKFPQPVIFNFLFHVYSRHKNSEEGFKSLEMCLYTLKKMAYGGIHDHVNKGFARYSVDDRWHVPHFEKMLYDQAQLVVSYCDAYVITKDDFFADIVSDILTYVSRDLSHANGGFYGAEDADSYPHEGAAHKQEGAFCVWEYDEIVELLNEKTANILHADLAIYHYNIKKEGNVKPSQDPHGELRNKNVLVCFGSYESTANKFGITVSKVKEILEKCHDILYAARQKRPKPHVDTKILTSWNGLMISGFAKAGFSLKNEEYVNKAIKAAEFVKRNLYNDDKTLLRCCYGNNDNIDLGPTPISGFLDDYAFLIRGLLDLYEATLDTDWLEWAEKLQEVQNSKFWDASAAGYFTSPEGDPSILIRGKEDQDGAEPCGNSVSVQNLIRLDHYLERKDFRQHAESTLKLFSKRLVSLPLALPEMASALMLYHDSPTQIIIVGSKDDQNTQALLDVVRSQFLPGRILAVADDSSGQSGLLYQRHETFSRLRSVDGKSAAYVCKNFACALPVTESTELATMFDKGF